MLIELLINEDKPMSFKIVRISDKTSEMLDKLSEKRKEENAFVRTKQDLVAEAVIQLYKKEIK